jgi:uncharacterized protein (TIGR02646 family)
MRPVSRGGHPRVNKKRAIFRDYVDARRFLVDRLGPYCSYCEIRHPSPSVEHVRPKSGHPLLRKRWSNLLLACTNCNSIKGSRAVTLGDYLWPDVDNTARAFEYLAGGRVRVALGLTARQASLAQNLSDLVGLMRTPATTPAATDVDPRWRERVSTWKMAQRLRSLVACNDTPELREAIVEAARGQGCWSIWMVVFATDDDMVRRLWGALPGTAKGACVDTSLKLRSRKGGRL